MSSNYPPDWDSRRKRVYERDDYTCQNCGAKGGKDGDTELHAHHGVPLSKGGTNKMSNLTTYCKDCHNAIHSDNSSLRYNKTIDQEVKLRAKTRRQSTQYGIVLGGVFTLFFLIGLDGSFVGVLLGMVSSPIAFYTTYYLLESRRETGLEFCDLFHL